MIGPGGVNSFDAIEHSRHALANDRFPLGGIGSANIEEMNLVAPASKAGCGAYERVHPLDGRIFFDERTEVRNLGASDLHRRWVAEIVLIL